MTGIPKDQPCSEFPLAMKDDPASRDDTHAANFTPVRELPVSPTPRLTVSLVMCPCWGRESPPLVLGLLGGNLRSKGYETHLFDLNNYFFHKTPFRLQDYWKQENNSFWSMPQSVQTYLAEHEGDVAAAVEMILATGSTVIGFSLLGSTLLFSLEMARRIKAARPDCLVILGGILTSDYYAGTGLLRHDFVDAIVVQEGDETLPEALRVLEEFGSFRPIPGLVYKTAEGIVDGGRRPPIPSLDALPFSDYTDFNISAYAKPDRLDIFSSRSCVMRCHYCDESRYFERYRFRSGRNMFDEVVHQRTIHPEIVEFNFSDSVLNGSIRAIREFCELLVEHGLSIRWGGQAVIRKEMTADLLTLMHRAGCTYLGYGVESGSDQVLKQMNKKMSTAAVASRVLRDTHEAGIRAYANFMFGYPTETEADFAATLDFIRDNSPWIDGVSPAMSFMVLPKNTYLYRNLAEFGVEPGSHPTYWKTRDGSNTYPIRFGRYERFCRLCINLDLYGGGVAEERDDKWRLLGNYYMHERELVMARRCYETAFLKHGTDPDTVTTYLECCRQLGDVEAGHAYVRACDEDTARQLAARPAGLIDCTARATDHNWLNGVARGWATAFFVADSAQARQELVVGATILFADGNERQVTETKVLSGSLMVLLTGPPLDGRAVGNPHKFTIQPPQGDTFSDRARLQ